MSARRRPWGCGAWWGAGCRSGPAHRRSPRRASISHCAGNALELNSLKSSPTEKQVPADPSGGGGKEGRTVVLKMKVKVSFAQYRSSGRSWGRESLLIQSSTPLLLSTTLLPLPRLMILEISYGTTTNNNNNYQRRLLTLGGRRGSVSRRSTFLSLKFVRKSLRGNPRVLLSGFQGSQSPGAAQVGSSAVDASSG